MKTVELKTAYHWHCDNCSEENFALPRKEELTDDEAESMFRYFHGMDEYTTLPEGWRDFEVVAIPEIVTCSKCSSSFQTIDEKMYE